MTRINPEFVERYQLEYERNPRSKVFAPLAEAYRKMGLLEEALRVAQSGVKIHPNFPGGLVALGKILIETKDLEKALATLDRATELSPDNLLAQTLKAEVLMELRRPKDALAAYKMVLFLNPKDTKAQEAVRKWEFLQAEEYKDDLFEMKPLFKKNASQLFKRNTSNRAPLDLGSKTRSGGNPPLSSSGDPGGTPGETPVEAQRALERALSLADAFTVRGDPASALDVLEDARRDLGSTPELENRILMAERAKTLSDQIHGDEDEIAEEISPAGPPSIEFPETFSGDFSGQENEPLNSARLSSTGIAPNSQRRARLEILLRRIDERRLS